MAITTAEELLRAGDIGRCELIRGELRTMIPPGYRHGRLQVRLGRKLDEFVEAQELGTVLGEVGFILSRDPDTVRAPDVAFMRQGHPEPERGFLSGAPDLAVEILSPDDRPGYVADKVAEWLEAGTAAVWIVDPDARTVTVHEPDRAPCVVNDTKILRGGDLLPGFMLEIREIFGKQREGRHPGNHTQECCSY